MQSVRLSHDAINMLAVDGILYQFDISRCQIVQREGGSDDNFRDSNLFCNVDVIDDDFFAVRFDDGYDCFVHATPTRIVPVESAPSLPYSPRHFLRWRRGQFAFSFFVANDRARLPIPLAAPTAASWL